MKKSLPTSTQPQIALTRIYGGGRKVEPLDGASNQPHVLKSTRIYGSKLTRQIRVRMKGTDDEDAFLIRKKDFDPAKHVRLD
jgi:hypothetical protein